MLVIRLVRTGKKNAPSYRIVLIQKTAPPQSGKFSELLGNYNPRLKEINLKKERIEYWLSQGVQTSDTVHNLLVSNNIIKADKIKKKFSRRKVGIPTQEASGKIIEEKKEIDKKEKKE